jgi:inner membrane protein
MDSLSSWVSEGRAWLGRRALFFKVTGVACLGLLLLIPLSMVDATRAERAGRYREAVSAITQTWGGLQRVGGPVLVVPYSFKVDENETRVVEGMLVTVGVVKEKRGEAFFMPEELVIDGQIEPSIRRRGIYETPVYQVRLNMTGQFAPVGMSFVNERDVQPLWEAARVGFALSDLRGTQDALKLTWGDTQVALQPGARLGGVGAGVHGAVALAAGEARTFALELTLNGSDALRFLPLARQTRVKLISTWADPSFGGAYLPVERTVVPEGFTARWQVLYYGRDYPQQWITGTAPSAEALEKSAFGVSLLEPVNAYRTVERATKYGVLFIALVFTTFFVFEAGCGLKLNALNYLLVGAALCLFYLATLALAEFVGFGVAYAAAAAASTVLIGLYAWRILGGARRALIVGALMGGVYGYLFFVLQMEDFALLAGTGALFVVLAAVMYATRKLRAGETAVVADRKEEIA